MAFVNPSTKPTIKVRPSSVPSIFISEQAMNKMLVYIDKAPGSDEIGWLGTVYSHNNEYLIDDVFLFDQQVHGTTTEITSDGLSAFANELLAQPNGVEIWNNLKMWGHSHVNMGVTPSGQDDKQMEEFSKIGHDFFIRLIGNKKGDVRIDLYNYETGTEYHGLPYEMSYDELSDEEMLLQQEIDKLYEKLQELELKQEEYAKAKYKAIEDAIVPEIKEKVKKLVYHTTTKYYGQQHKQSTYPTYGHYNQRTWYDDDEVDYGYGNKAAKGKNNDLIDGVKATVYSFFSYQELLKMAYTYVSYEDYLYDVAVDPEFDKFSDNDLNTIWNTLVQLGGV